jgi:Asp-tRNA(Asn)/Glu-tRNA(Gln) amidotransferase A subunit family amidase
MRDNESWRWSAGEIVSRIATRQVSACEVAESALSRIAKINPTINAICTVTPEVAMEQARAVDARLCAGYPARPLEGVPYTVKDNIPVKGILSTYGSQLFKDLIPGEDALSVERLRESGAILVGKSNTPEMADDPFCNTANALFGQTRNPWDLNRTPGASSGGGASATAAGMGAIALGTDWGGSIRGPAAFCGVVGMRPSSGLVPVYPDDTRTGFAWDFPVEHGHGPLARSVADVARALDVLVGPDARAPGALPFAPAPEFVRAVDSIRDLRGRRVAVTTDLGGLAPVDSQAAAAVHQAAALLASLGCEIVEDAPDLRTLNEVIAGSRPLGVALRYSEYVKTHRDKLSQRLLNQLEAALQVDLSTIARAERLRAALTHRVDEFMRDYDHILSPTWGVLPFRIDMPFDYMIDGRHVPNFFDTILFTYSMSVLGMPSISVPVGLSRESLPLAVQIAGRRFADAAVLEAAAAYEIARGIFPWPPEPDGTQVVHPMDPMFLTDPGTAAWTSAPPPS